MAEVTVEITNKCPGRIWYRAYHKGGNFVGSDVAGGESKTAQLPAGFDSLRGLKWEKGEDETWAPSFRDDGEEAASKYQFSLTPVFGPRTATSIKVFMACMAAPADPMDRNDITLINKFREQGVPEENIFMLLEKQVTPAVISVTLANLIANCSPDDILFVYLGGHGNQSGGTYHLCSWGGSTDSHLVLNEVEKARCPVFMVVDSCFSGRMVVDAKAHFTDARPRPPTMTIVTSTLATITAMTGWRLVAMLIEQIFTGGYTTPEEIGNYVVEHLKTPQADQRATVYTM